MDAWPIAAVSDDRMADGRMAAWPDGRMAGWVMAVWAMADGRMARWPGHIWLLACGWMAHGRWPCGIFFIFVFV